MLVAAVLVVLAIVVGKDLTPLRGLRLSVLAVAAGVVLAGVYASSQSFRQMLRVASVGPVVFVALFVLASPSGTVLLHRDAKPTRSVQQLAAARRHPPIVMIVFDEFPLISLMDGKGGIDARHYPNFAELASRSTWYRNATGVSGYTPLRSSGDAHRPIPLQARRAVLRRVPRQYLHAVGGGPSV